ncbi:DUF2619 domain-containing protein [Terribacillus sp. JSM ZJ617]|uniref:DUF2619 domain-containing protein n=1 Tax=Terribacillus sp. JSM ZJ617 TaxID=3342119 RepID=UPI0035A8765E
MHPLFEKALIEMVVLRLFSGGIEITAAMLMLKINDLEKELVINSSLAIVESLVLIVTTAIGVAVWRKVSLSTRYCGFYWESESSFMG